MPNEATIARMMDIFTEVIDLGGVEERTAIVPNLSVTDAAPTGLTGFIIVQDDRDGDNILAKTVPGVVYANNDKVNVLFVKGTEPIAFQQGSESPSAGLWQIVPSTSTDIFYDNGDVGIGKSVAPDASLEILDTTQAQLRLTHTEDTKFVDFTLDTNHDLTIKPSSTGQIIMQPTTDSIDFFQVLDADGGTPILNVDSVNERVGIGIAAPNELLHLSFTGTLSGSFLRISGTNDTHVFNITPTIATSSSPQLLRFVPTIDPTGVITNVFGINNNLGVGGSSSNAITNVFGVNSDLNFRDSYGGTITTFKLFNAGNPSDGSSGSPVITTNFGYHCEDLTLAGTNWAFYADGSTESFFGGSVGIGNTGINAKLHVDQASTTAAIPVALFDQADVSEEIFEFVSTIGVGNAIEAVGAKALTTTHFIKVTLPGALTRYFPVGTIA